jgi:hypothetical protein
VRRVLEILSDAIGRETGGEQAANALQPDSSNRHATTANAKVRDAIEA